MTIDSCIFNTPRLVFRVFAESDLDALARINADEVVSRYVGDGDPLDRENTALWIRNSVSNVRSYGYGTGAVVLRASQTLIGWAGIARPGDGTEEVIYGLARCHWGQGLGSELLTGLVDWADNVLGLPELRATVDPENAASVRMLLSHGFAQVTVGYQGDPHSDLYVRSFAHNAS